MNTQQTIANQLSKRKMKEISEQPVQNIDDYMFERTKLSDLNNNQLVNAIIIIGDKDPYIRRKKFSKPHSNHLINEIEYNNILSRLIHYQRANSEMEPPPPQSKKQRPSTPPSKAGKYKIKSRKRRKRSKKSKRSQKYNSRRNELVENLIDF